MIGSAGGGIDGGQWQMPMPHLIHIGAITNNQPVRMVVLGQLNTQGNGIAIAGMHAGKGLGLDVSGAAEKISAPPKDASSKLPTLFPTPIKIFGSATGWPRGA